jgi:hypothetical protein
MSGDYRLPQRQSNLIAAISRLINSTTGVVTQVVTIVRRSGSRGTGHVTRRDPRVGEDIADAHSQQRLRRPTDRIGFLIDGTVLES